MRTFESEELLDWQNPHQEKSGGSGMLPLEAENYTDRFRKAFIRKAKNDVTRYVIEQYFEGLQSGTKPESIASLFNEDVDFYIPGHPEPVPWSGRRSGRAGVADFIYTLREETASIAFNVRSILVDGAEAVALGELESRVKSTGEVIESEYVMTFTVHNAIITRFRLFKDSVAVAQVVRNQEPVSSYY